MPKQRLSSLCRFTGQITIITEDGAEKVACQICGEYGFGD